MGRRTSVTESGNTTYYHYDGWNVVAETHTSGTTLATYVYDNSNQPISMTRGGQTYYYQTNAHGDVMTLTDSTGAVVNTYSYDPWGKVLSSSEGVSNPYRYAGYRYDETIELYYLNSRYYDSSLARFLTQDSNTGHIKKPMSINSYIYCLDNPVTLIDQSGTAGNSVHRDLTSDLVYLIAINEFKLSPQTAFAIAQVVSKTDINVDKDSETKSKVDPGRHMNVNKSGPPSQLVNAQGDLDYAIDHHDPTALGRALHSLQDMIAHGTEYNRTRHWYQGKIKKMCGKDLYDPDMIEPGSPLYLYIGVKSAEYIRSFLSTLSA